VREGIEDVAECCAGDVARIVEELLLAVAPSEEAFATLMGVVEDRIAAALVDRGDVAPACRTGCAACCTVNVGTLAVEGAAIAGFLRRRLGPDGAREASRALLAFHDRVRWLEDGERIRERLACPFLDASRACTIHPVRPLACRSVSSLDAEDCRRAIAERGEDDAEGGMVRMDVLQRDVYEAALHALGRALAARGLDGRRRDVTGMAGAFLADAGLAAAFGSGGRLPLE
jgi:Fe-S-cluster containining protein